MSLPAAKIPTRSQTDWTWARRWLESRTASPRSRTSVAEQVQDLDDADRVDRRRRLVEDQHRRILDQGVGDAEPLEHAPRVRVDVRSSARSVMPTCSRTSPIRRLGLAAARGR